MNRSGHIVSRAASLVGEVSDGHEAAAAAAASEAPSLVARPPHRDAKAGRAPSEAPGQARPPLNAMIMRMPASGAKASETHATTMQRAKWSIRALLSEAALS